MWCRNIGKLGTSYSTTKGPCFDPDAIVPDKKLKSGSGSALAYFKCAPCAAQLPEEVSYVVVVCNFTSLVIFALSLEYVMCTSVPLLSILISMDVLLTIRS